MDIGGAQIVVVMVAGLVLVVVIMIVMVVVQHHRTDDIHAKAENRDDHRLEILDRNRLIDPHHRFEADADRDHAENERAREAREIAELARAEREVAVLGVAARHPIGPCREPERADMRRHVHAVGQERHRAEGEPGDDLHHHERRGEIDDEARSRFGAAMALAEIDVIVGPGVVVAVVHDGENIGRSIVLHQASLQTRRSWRTTKCSPTWIGAESTRL